MCTRACACVYGVIVCLCMCVFFHTVCLFLSICLPVYNCMFRSHGGKRHVCPYLFSLFICQLRDWDRARGRANIW